VHFSGGNPADRVVDGDDFVGRRYRMGLADLNRFPETYVMHGTLHIAFLSVVDARKKQSGTFACDRVVASLGQLLHFILAVPGLCSSGDNPSGVSEHVHNAVFCADIWCNLQ
jgi:hypothetical protein